MVKKGEIIVLGLGNVQYGDDGIGVVAAQKLQQEHLPGVKVVAAGINPEIVLKAFNRAAKLLILDCFAGGGKPGKIYRFKIQELLDQLREISSPQQIGLLTFLKSLGNEGPEEVIILGVEPERLTRDTTLSWKVTAALEALTEMAKEEIHCWLTEKQARDCDQIML